MIHKLTAVVAFTLTLACHHIVRAEPPAGESVEVSVSDHTAVMAVVPDGWLKVMSAAGRSEGRTIEMHPDKAKSLAMKITFLPLPEEKDPTEEQLNKISTAAVSPYVSGSVEKKADFKKLESKLGIGLLATMTDADLANATKTKPEEYKYATAGVILSRGMIAIYSIFSNDLNSADSAKARGVLSGLALK